MPAPFGLIRYGVAPDHQTTKNVQRNYDKTASQGAVRYFGNVEVGRDIALDELRGMYDAVVLAVGAPFDRPLGILGSDKKGVIGSAAFVGWYNGHPDFRDVNPDLDTSAVAVIGNGNVAIDVARVLVKTREEMATSDIVDYALDAVQAGSVTDVYMFGRRGPIEAKFTNVELREMGKLETCVPVVDAAVLPDEVDDPSLSDRDARLKARNLATLKEFAERDANELPKRVHFEFYAAPVEVLGGDRVEGLRLERTKVEGGRAVGTGEFVEIECGLVIPAIGYRSSGIAGVAFDDREGRFVNDDGRVDAGLYAVGWAKRGPTGTIATNRPDGQTAAAQIVEDHGAGSGKPGRAALEALLDDRGVRRVGYEEWKRIDAAETAAAADPAPRRKLVTLDDMLSLLDAG